MNDRIKIRCLLKNFLLFLVMIPGMLAAQNALQVKGTVTDSKTGETLIGVSVAVKGGSTGTVTNIDGEYTLQVNEGVTLVFRSIGYVEQEHKATGSTLNVQLSENTTDLDEVIVIGYGTQKKGDLTTSVTSVSTKGLQDRPIVSAAAAIQGKAAGVQISQPSGQPGGALRVRIRGNTSINASSNPLYVVDGIPMDEVNFLSPNDIESMTILKDASSSAIYGSRASNGVVLITTKTPNKGQSKIEFNSYVGFSKVNKNFKSLNTEQYRELMNETGAVTLPDGLVDHNTDWFKETYRTGFNQNYQLTISNATDSYRYSVSGGYTKEKGVINVAFFERYNFRVNLENDIRSWLKVSFNGIYSDYTDNDIISGTGANRAGVVLSVINTPTYAPIWSAKEGEEGWYHYDFYGANVTNPVSNMSRSADNRNSTNRLIGSFSTLITFAPELNLKSSVSLDRFYNKTTTWLDQKKTAYGRELFGQAEDKRQLGTLIIVDNILNYNKNIGDLHHLEAMGGTSGTASRWSRNYLTATHFPDWGIHTLNAGNKIEQNGGSEESNWSIMSYLARVSYNFDSKYLFTANFRADGSSKLSKNNRWGYFPSLSAGWRISSEKFMEDFTFIDDLKLRAGWGKVGNQSGISDYAAYSKYTINRFDWTKPEYANAVPGASLSSDLFNPDFKWETTAQTNVGVDLSILNGRLTFTADAYYKKTSDLIMYVNFAEGAQYNGQWRNNGEMVNKGLEFAVSSVNTTGEFEWDTQFNISFNRNKLTNSGFQKEFFEAKVSDATEEKVVKMQQGKPLGMFWGYISDGVNPETGDLVYRDLDKDGKLSEGDQTFIGDPNPDFTFGFTNNFAYKNFQLNVLFTGSYGNDIFNASRMETEGMYNGNNQTRVVLDRWKRPGMITDVPRATKSSYHNLLSSTRWIEDGSYLRLKSVTLSYNFKSGFLKKIGINKLQMYVTGTNLLTLTKYSGFDPEVNQYGNDSKILGIDWGTYPQSKSFVGGINLEF